MLTCLPQSICSWNYRILGTRFGESRVAFNQFSQQGTIDHDGNHYEIVKEGLLPGRWTLHNHNSVLGHAEKSVMIRHYTLFIAGPAVTVKVAHFLGAAFSVEVGGLNVGEIRKMHPFTRRAVIDCSKAVSELNQIFAFWFCALTWRNTSRSS
ncbi:hypothetical protein BH10PLA1_BH10PLA1_08990 [soil metagenome]